MRVPNDEAKSANMATLILLVKLKFPVKANNFVTLPKVDLRKFPEALLLADSLNASPLVIKVHIRHGIVAFDPCSDISDSVGAFGVIKIVGKNAEWSRVRRHG